MKTTGFRHRVAMNIRRVPGLVRMMYYPYRLIQPKYTVGVIGVVFNNEGRVLLVEHVFHPQLPWGLPGGWTSNNEHPADAVKRELREELKLQVDLTRLVHLEKTEYNHIDMAFLCQVSNDIGTLSYELLDYHWYDPDALPRIHRFHYDAIMQAKLMREAAYVTAD